MKHMGTVLALLVSACGGGGGDDGGGSIDANNADPTPWIGNWNTTGTQSTTCPGIPTQTSQLSGLVVIAAGAMAGTIKTTANNCTLIWDLDHNNASLQTGQLCTVTVAGNNYTVTWTNSSSTINGTTITGTNTGSTNNNCSFMQQYTMTKT
jgi:hypothetical protein